MSCHSPEDQRVGRDASVPVHRNEVALYAAVLRSTRDMRVVSAYRGTTTPMFFVVVSHTASHHVRRQTSAPLPWVVRGLSRNVNSLLACSLAGDDVSLAPRLQSPRRLNEKAVDFPRFRLSRD